MKKILFLGYLFLVIYGCKSPIPKDIIQPDKMGKILYDIHIVDGYISTMPNPDSAKKVAASYYKGVYKKFDVDSVSYTKSMDFYYKNPEIMTEMYKKIQADLKKTKAKTEKVQLADAAKAEKKRLDSIKTDSLLKKNLKKSPILDSVAKNKKDSLAKVKKAKLRKKSMKKNIQFKNPMLK